ncbi:uncharacterized protein LOC116295712 isoform X1 [Actinia tenebrosa]|uniref:Uncharacterized protein LOC116295712 isoform X1 n=1 Tax=Actinia tenebrosa TaxID=6105 RepID=A0A6P8I3J6_ACTTE|nr:uncharacterized protein LOC116295712 isoform X1 [Actinia tenebrosa]
MHPRPRSQLIFSFFLFYFHFRYCLLANNSLGLQAFFTRVEFHKLEGSSIQTVFVNSIIKCCFKCQRFSDCVALNIVTLPNQDGLYECVLLRKEAGDSTRPLTASHLYHHYTLRLMPPPNSIHWPGDQRYKINTSPVCFGTKDSSFGRFYIKQNMTITAIKLVHLSGYLMCNVLQDSCKSNWGCAAYTTTRNNSYEDRLYTIITDHQDHKILPKDEFIKSFVSLSYSLPGITSQSPELLFTNFTTPMNVTAVQEFRIWYGQDLVNKSESNNEGNACVEVYVYGNETV